MGGRNVIKRLLIANRGEIVRRIQKACRDLDIKTAAIYSEPDRNASYINEADEAFHIGPANPMKSYLNIDVIIDAAKRFGADAIHPGYGFLSENSSFAKAAVASGLIWVGPSTEVLKAVESKCYCRNIATRMDVPVIPGTLKAIEDVKDIFQFAQEHGYPIFLKLDKGGGGKGIEIVREKGQAQAVFERISRIGLAAFDSSACYIEKVVDGPRHIEVQFLADHFDNYVCLGERECSIQRRHQKIIEESPSLVITKKDREVLFGYTTKLAQTMGYRGAGTMEFLRSEEGNYYFMEVNARLQVEHPVTEFVVGVDIVKNQIRIASDEELEFQQDGIKMNGHAIEARVYAEDPVSFAPSPGTITRLRIPTEKEYLRIDHALEENGAVPPFYDPLLAKVIAWGPTRPEASCRLKEALTEFHIEGVKTTIPVNLAILESRNFEHYDFNTGFIEDLLAPDSRHH
jgi:acetyl-CoA carboxylase biotin carboxylase subunit